MSMRQPTDMLTQAQASEVLTTYVLLIHVNESQLTSYLNQEADTLKVSPLSNDKYLKHINAEKEIQISRNKLLK